LEVESLSEDVIDDFVIGQTEGEMRGKNPF